MKKYLNVGVKLGFCATIIIFIALVLMAIIVYPEYGHGIGYYIVLVVPIGYVSLGFTALLGKKWWVLILSTDIILGIYAYLIDRHIGIMFFIPLICYTLIGIFVGCCCRLFLKQCKK